MPLDATNRARVAATFMREVANLAAGPISASRASVVQAVGEVDDWVDANQAAFNSALNVEARGGMSTAQKSVLLAFVLMRRIGRLRAEED